MITFGTTREGEERSSRRTLRTFAATVSLYVLRVCKGPNPVLPTQLNFDNLEGLVARMVAKILQ